MGEDDEGEGDRNRPQFGQGLDDQRFCVVVVEVVVWGGARGLCEGEYGHEGGVGPAPHPLALAVCATARVVWHVMRTSRAARAVRWVRRPMVQEGLRMLQLALRDIVRCTPRFAPRAGDRFFCWEPMFLSWGGTSAPWLRSRCPSVLGWSRSRLRDRLRLSLLQMQRSVALLQTLHTPGDRALVWRRPSWFPVQVFECSDYYFPGHHGTTSSHKLHVCEVSSVGCAFPLLGDLPFCSVLSLSAAPGGVRERPRS